MVKLIIDLRMYCDRCGCFGDHEVTKEISFAEAMGPVGDLGRCSVEVTNRLNAAGWRQIGRAVLCAECVRRSYDESVQTSA
jgi:hypothetical protein